MSIQSTAMYNDTVSMMKDLTEKDMLLIKEFIKRLSRKTEIRSESYNPYKPLTREEIIEQLAIAKRHAEEGEVMPAPQASAKIREKDGL